MKWALFVFAFVAPLLVGGIFFFFETFKKKEELSLKNETVRKELWNLGASFVLCLISAIVGLFFSDVSAANIFVGNIFISLLAREMTPLIKLDWKKLDKKAITPIAKAAIAFLGFVFEISLFQTWSIYLLSGMRLGAFALLAYLVGNLTESYYENKDLSIIRVAFVFFFILFLFCTIADPKAWFDAYPFEDGLKYLEDNPYLYYNQFDAFMQDRKSVV